MEHQANQVLNKAHLKSERQLMVVLSELVNQIEQKKKGVVEKIKITRNQRKPTLKFNLLLISVKLILPQFITPIDCSLFPKHENVRYKKISSDFLTGQFQISRRHELKAQLIALYSGKIAEFLFFKRGLFTPNQHAFHSDFAQTDLTQASHLIYQIVDHWYLYLPNNSFIKMFSFSTNQNKSELLDTKTHHFLERLSVSNEFLLPSIELDALIDFHLHPPSFIKFLKL